LGWELRRALSPLGDVVALDRRGIDLANPDSVREAARRVRPELIVNAAGYTAVDRAEAEPEAAMAVNGVAPGILAEEARKLDAALVHFSTDYVFDGRKPAPYTEADEARPLGAYGRSKLAGDVAVQAAGGRYVILRTSWLYAARGHNFFLTIRRLAGERDELRVVDDQTGAPTWSRTLAEATARIVARSLAASPARPFADTSGLYHLTAAGAATWFGFARAIVERGPALGLTRVPRLVPIPTSGYPLPASRPANSVLSNAKVAATFGIVMPAWEAAFASCVEDMIR
jgi:dTDP-4-dehydrorhamnose reductase